MQAQLSIKIGELQELKPIDFNFQEIKNELETQLEKYQGLAIAEKDLVEAKATRATLNRLKKAIDDKRIEIKKRYTLPLNEFEGKVKILTQLISEPAKNIDDQIKKFEQAKKDEKLAQIKEIFQAFAKHECIKFEMIFQDQYLNVGYAIGKIHDEISEKINTMNLDIDAISKLNSKYEVQLIDYYFKTFSVGKCLDEKARLEKLEAQQAEIKAKQAEIRTKQAETQPVVEVKKIVEDQNTKIQTETPTIHIIDFRVEVTQEQAQLIKRFLIDNNIKFGSVK